jgi:uncharacterized membrane protein YfcA
MLIAALIALLGATVQSASAFGFGLIAGPVLFAQLQPHTALTLLLLCGAELNLLMLFTERRRRLIRWPELMFLAAGAVPGLILGALILHAVSKPALQVTVGAAVLVTVAFQLRRGTAALAAHPAGSPRPVTGAPGALSVGAVSGLLTTTTNTTGPPLVLFFGRHATDPLEVRDSLTAAFLAFNVLGVVTLAISSGAHEHINGQELVWLLLATALGHQVGRRLLRRLNADRFRIVGVLLCTIAGIASIVAGAAG